MIAHAVVDGSARGRTRRLSDACGVGMFVVASSRQSIAHVELLRRLPDAAWSIAR
jgi:hypothetical protein